MMITLGVGLSVAEIMAQMFVWQVRTVETFTCHCGSRDITLWSSGPMDFTKDDSLWECRRCGLVITTADVTGQWAGTL